MKLAVVFPGQGSQYAGMGSGWLGHQGVAQAYAAADSALGFKLSSICHEGPDDLLKLTANTQPAILATSIAIFWAIRAELPTVEFFAGHSLGEYTALVAGGSLELAEAVCCVNERGEHMQTAVPAGQGAMAAVIRLEQEQVVAINAEVNTQHDDPVEIANYNSLEQLVVTGGAAAVHRAMELYLAAGAKRVVELPVSAPFHSSMMAPAADALKPTLDSLAFKPLAVQIVANLTVEHYPLDVSLYAMLLHAQIYNPVRWVETIQYFVAQGVSHLLEVGPGKVLRMLTPKITKSLKTYNVDKPSDLAGLGGWLSQEANA